MLNKDDIRLGIVLGFIAPLLGMIIYYFIAYYPNQVAFSEFLGFLYHSKRILTGVSSISLVANAALFTFYVNAGKDKTIKGIFLATVLYGITVLLIKLVA